MTDDIVTQNPYTADKLREAVLDAFRREVDASMELFNWEYKDAVVRAMNYVNKTFGVDLTEDMHPSSMDKLTAHALEHEPVPEPEPKPKPRPVIKIDPLASPAKVTFMAAYLEGYNPGTSFRLNDTLERLGLQVSFYQQRTDTKAKTRTGKLQKRWRVTAAGLPYATDDNGNSCSAEKDQLAWRWDKLLKDYPDVFKLRT